MNAEKAVLVVFAVMRVLVMQVTMQIVFMLMITMIAAENAQLKLTVRVSAAVIPPKMIQPVLSPQVTAPPVSSCPVNTLLRYNLVLMQQ